MIEKLLNRLIYKQKKALWSLSSKSTLDKMMQHEKPSIKRLGSILNNVIKENAWSEEDNIQFQKVKAISDGYFSSEEIVQDFDSDIKHKVSDVHAIASSTEKWGKLIYEMVRDYKPRNILELGTCLGISTAYQILGLKVNGFGKITSVDANGSRLAVAQRSLEKLGYTEYRLAEGIFFDVLPNLIPEIEPIDIAFIDGHHDGIATMKYFEMIYPHLSTNAIVIFDDINWSKGMRQFWSKMSVDNRAEVVVDLVDWGICIIDKKSNTEKIDFKLCIE